MKKIIILFVLLTSSAQAQVKVFEPLPDNITTPCNASYMQCVTTLQDIGKEQAACVTVLGYLGVTRTMLPLMSELDVRVFLSKQIPFSTVALCEENLISCFQTMYQYSGELAGCYKQLKKVIKRVVK